MKKRKRPPRKVWFQFHRKSGELWAEPFFDEASAMKDLQRGYINNKGKLTTLYNKGWRVVGPYIR